MAGESFAGQWIPYFADAILDSNLGIPLRGIAIGNGWMDAKRQYLSYLDYSVKMGLLEENSADWKYVKKETDKCAEEIEKVKDEPIKIRACERVIMGVINKKTAEYVSVFPNFRWQSESLTFAAKTVKRCVLTCTMSDTKTRIPPAE